MTIAPAASPAASSSQLIDTALRAAAGITGMQLVFLSSIDAQTYTWRQLQGKLDGVTAGSSLPFADTFCSRLLDGAPPSTASAASDPAYADAPLRTALGVTSYVGVPLRSQGAVTGTLGAFDTAAVPVTRSDLQVLSTLARVISAQSDRSPDVQLRRTPGGWEVEVENGSSDPAEDLTVAMSLGDLIAAELGERVPPQRPQRPEDGISEVERLRVQVTQLEHALAARVLIEQAIGVIAQRFGLAPREAFDRIRKTARSRGQRVHDLAGSIVQSTRDPNVVLPNELR